MKKLLFTLVMVTTALVSEEKYEINYIKEENRKAQVNEERNCYDHLSSYDTMMKNVDLYIAKFSKNKTEKTFEKLSTFTDIANLHMQRFNICIKIKNNNH